MKLKRFLALAVSLAMVISMIPAFSLTASASSVTDVINTIAGAEVVWTMPDTTGWSDAAITNLEGWSSNVSSGYVNLISSTDGNYIQAYGGNPNLTVNTPGYAAGTDGVILEFKFKQSGWNNGTFYHKHTFYDIDGVEIGHAWIDKNQTGFIYENPIGFPADGTKIAVVAMNNTGEGTHNTYWYVAGELKFTQEDLAGEINGFGSFSVSGGADPWYIHMGYRSLTIASYTHPEDTTEYTITVNYGTTGTTETLTGLKTATVTAPAKQITVGDTLYIFNSASYTIEGDATVTLDPTKTLSVADGLIAHYPLESDATDVVNALNGSAIGSAGVTYNANGYVTMPGGVGQGALEIPAEVASYLTGDYTVSMWVRQDSSYTYDSKAVAFWDIAVDNNNYDRMFYQQAGTGITVQHRGDSPSRVYTTNTSDATKDNWALVTAVFDLDANTITTYINGTALTGDTTNGTWGTGHAPANIYTRANGAISFYLGHNQWNNADNPELMGDMAEVRIYNKALTADEVSALLADKNTITVKYVDENGVTITDSTAVEYFSSSATFDVPTAVTSSTGAVYELTSLSYAEDAESVSVTATGTEYTATYTSVEAIPNGVEAVPAVTVIDGNAPILPSTVTVTTNKAGITYTANVTWDTSSLTVGTNTVTGTVEGYDVDATATVTVLEQTFTLDDLSSWNSQGEASSNATMFPVAVSDEFYIEMDVKWDGAFVNDFITLRSSSNPGFFGPEQIAIGFNNAAGFRPVNGNGNGGRAAADATLETLQTGVTYRFLIKGDASTDKYTVTLTKPDGTTVVAADYGFRTASDDIASVVIMSNGGSYNGAFNATNVKVYAPSVDLETYTATVVAGGTTLETFNVYTSSGADLGYNNVKIFPNVRIPDYTDDGYVFKSKSVNTSSKTITLTYEAVAESNFFDNVANDTKVPSLNMLGAHDAFTNGMSSSNVMRDAAGLDQGDDGTSTAASAGSTAINYSKTQEKDALSLLNYGVRYFDVRLSRSDNTASYGLFGTSSAPHTNSVFYTTHGLLADEFRPIAYTIAQWAKTHPGELLVLDFHEVWDNTGDLDGNGSGQASTWNAINALLVEAGIYDYVTINNSIGSFKNITYGQLTNNGAKAGIILIGRHGATNNGIGSFIYRGGNDSIDFEGKFYSYYNSDNSPSSHDTGYIQDQVDYMANYVNVDANGDHPIKHMLRVMQGQSVNISGLLNQSSSDNTALYNSLTNASYSTWLSELPIVMVDGVGRNTDNLLALLKSCNEAKSATINYVDSNGTTVKSVTENVMIGSLYEKAQFAYVSAGADKYYVTDGVPTAPANSELLMPVPYSNNITINVDVTKLGNVYTLINDGRVGSLGTNNDATVQNTNVLNRGNESDNGLNDFLGFNWGGAGTYHRIGVAELDVVANQNGYLLKSEYARTGATTTIWAVSAEQYANLHSIEEVYATMSEENTLASGKNLTNEVRLDREKLNAIAGESGKIVLFVNSTGGLYGLDGETLEIVSGWLVSCDGAETVVANGDTYTLPSTAIVYVENDEDLYAPGAVPTVTSDMTFVGYAETGLEMVGGAQVRIGYGPNSDGKVGSESGLRFITTQDNNNTVAGLDGVTVGVVVTAEGGKEAVKIPATKWQNDDNSIFTTALTNLAEGNFNRKFKAYPYVAYTDVLGNEGGAVVSDSYTERSIYQVAAGLLSKASADGTEYDQSALESTILYNVLNAYVNQTGIRLTLADTNADEVKELTVRTEGSGAYSGDAFFTVGDTTVNGTVYTVTLTASGDKTVFNDYWKEYIRINNNNKAVVNGIDVTSTVSEDGKTLTLTFDASKATK